MPEPSDGLRIDAGYREGDAVSPHYDAMLAKVIAWAPTRDQAIERLNRGLEETDVRGIVSNIPFLSALVTHPQVRANTIDTGFIERELKEPDAGRSGAARSRALRGGGSHSRRRSQSRARRSAFAVANRRLDAGRPPATAVYVPPWPRGRATGQPELWQRTGDALDRRP